MPLEEQDTSPNDDLVRVVGVPLIADVVEPAELFAIACHDPVASGGREQAPELRLPPCTLLCILIAAAAIHEGSVIRSPLF